MLKIFATSLYSTRKFLPHNIVVIMQSHKPDQGHLNTISEPKSIVFMAFVVGLFFFVFKSKLCVTAQQSEKLKWRSWGGVLMHVLRLMGLLGLSSDILINCTLACWNGPTCNSFSCFTRLVVWLPSCINACTWLKFHLPHLLQLLLLLSFPLLLLLIFAHHFMAN